MFMKNLVCIPVHRANKSIWSSMNPLVIYFGIELKKNFIHDKKTTVTTNSTVRLREFEEHSENGRFIVGFTCRYLKVEISRQWIK